MGGTGAAGWRPPANGFPGPLKANRCALCIADADDDLEIPFVSTANWGYLRLRREEYTTGSLKKWMRQVQTQEWEKAFVFFKHEDAGTGPKLAAQFMKLAEDRPTDTRSPVLLKKGK